MNIRGVMKNRREKGFTLVELLVVIAIIGVLATLVLLQLGTARGRARDTKRITDVNQIRTACEQFFEDNSGQYPTAAGWKTEIAPYLTRVPSDPLNASKDYIYRTNSDRNAFQVATELESDAAALDNDADIVASDFTGAIDAGVANETCASRDITDNDCMYDQGVKF